MSIGYSKKRPKALVVLLAAAGLSGCWVDLAELNLLVVFRNALSTDHGASVVHVLGLGADVVTALPECTNKTETLATAGETADKRRSALVLSAADLYAYGVLHTRNIAYGGVSCLGRMQKRPRVLVDARTLCSLGSLAEVTKTIAEEVGCDGRQNNRGQGAEQAAIDWG